MYSTGLGVALGILGIRWHWLCVGIEPKSPRFTGSGWKAEGRIGKDVVAPADKNVAGLLRVCVLYLRIPRIQGSLT